MPCRPLAGPTPMTSTRREALDAGTPVIVGVGGIRFEP
jgi:hypothetical protein